jgi:hypothetical protein
MNKNEFEVLDYLNIFKIFFPLMAQDFLPRGIAAQGTSKLVTLRGNQNGFFQFLGF